MRRGSKSERIEKILVFYVCVWLELGRMEKSENEKLFIWLRIGE